mmetsp:Transcript_5169/g.7183  ORF Transcript_5169/g.7183 Transcript_5169/m.7183 type:complete len:241 (+) Transcript_5169:333-1055(+)
MLMLQEWVDLGRVQRTQPNDQAMDGCTMPSTISLLHILQNLPEVDQKAYVLCDYWRYYLKTKEASSSVDLVLVRGPRPMGFRAPSSKLKSDYVLVNVEGTELLALLSSSGSLFRSASSSAGCRRRFRSLGVALCGGLRTLVQLIPDVWIVVYIYPFSSALLLGKHCSLKSSLDSIDFSRLLSPAEQSRVSTNKCKVRTVGERGQFEFDPFHFLRWQAVAHNIVKSSSEATGSDLRDTQRN